MKRKVRKGNFMPIFLPLVFTDQTTPAELAKQISEEFDNIKKDSTALTATIEAVQKAAKDDAVKELKPEIDKANERATELALKVTELETKGGAWPETVISQVNKFIDENKDKIKELFQNKSGVIEFTTKAPESMTTGSATSVGTIPTYFGAQVAPAGKVNLDTTFVDALVTKFDTQLAAYPYTEVLPKDGDFAFVAEGAEKPQVDFKIETRYATPVKAAGYVVLTEESIQDVKGMQGIATDYLRKKHDLKRQDGILFGDGVAPNPKGATVYARTFSAGPMALAVDNPNFMDVVNAGVVDVFTTHNYTDEMPFKANLALVNPVDFFLNMVSAKDADGKPLYPTATLFGEVSIGGLTIRPEAKIPAGKIFIADMSKYNVTDYMEYTVKIGWINDQLITNQFTMVGESRFHAFVKKLDEQAFLYDNIATIKTAITAA